MILGMAQMGNDGTLWSIDKQAGVAQCYVGSGRWQANTNRQMKWISCASATQVWGVDAAGKACVLTPAPVGGSSAGAVTALGGRTGPIYVWATSAVTWSDSTGKSGTIPLPTGSVMSLEATDPAQGGPYALWASITDYSANPPRTTIQFWNGTAWNDSGASGVNTVAVGLDNSVWSYMGNAQALGPGLYRYNAQGKWVLAVKSPTGGLMVSYTVLAAYDIWAVDINFALYHWNGQAWTKQPDGSPTAVWCGWDGAIYGVNTTLGGRAQPLQRFNGFGQWFTLPVTITTINDLLSRDGSGVWWMTGVSGGMQFWPGYVWQDMGATLTTISGAVDGTVWGTDPNNAVLRFNGKTWDTMPGQATQVSVGGANLVWSIDASGNAQRWTGSAWEAHGNPGAAISSIAALGDGTVLATAAVSQVGQVFNWDGKSWTATGETADQIAGTDQEHLAGVFRGVDGKGGFLVLGSPFPSKLSPETMQNVTFSPPNPVFYGTVMTLSWPAYPGAVNYDARINGAAGSFEATVTGTSISYTLKLRDIRDWMGGWVHALDGSGAIVAQGSASYYCGNGSG
jgi:hypothetical protein